MGRTGIWVWALWPLGIPRKRSCSHFHKWLVGCFASDITQKDVWLPPRAQAIAGAARCLFSRCQGGKSHPGTEIALEWTCSAAVQNYSSSSGILWLLPAGDDKVLIYASRPPCSLELHAQRGWLSQGGSEYQGEGERGPLLTLSKCSSALLASGSA